MLSAFAVPLGWRDIGKRTWAEVQVDNCLHRCLVRAGARRPNATCGTIGGIIVLLTWFYVSSLAILTGAELNAEIEHASPYGKDPGEEAPGKKDADLPPVVPAAPPAPAPAIG